MQTFLFLFLFLFFSFFIKNSDFTKIQQKSLKIRKILDQFCQIYKNMIYP